MRSLALPRATSRGVALRWLLVTFVHLQACGARAVVPGDPSSDGSDAPLASTDDGGGTATDAPTPSGPSTPGDPSTAGEPGAMGPNPQRLVCHDLTGRVGQRASLRADSPARASVQWSIELAPEGSVAQIALPDVPSPTFVPDVAGEWIFRVAIFDGQQQLDTCDTHFVAVP